MSPTKYLLFYPFLKRLQINLIFPNNVHTCILHISISVTKNVNHQGLLFYFLQKLIQINLIFPNNVHTMYIAYINKCNQECQPSRLAFLLSSKADTNKFDIFRQCTCVLHISISLTRNVNHQRLAFLLVSKAYTNN